VLLSAPAHSPAPFCEGWESTAPDPVLSKPKARPLRFAVVTLRQKAQARRENLKRSPEFGGSPLLQQEGAGLQSSGKAIHSEKMGFSPGFFEASAKAPIKVQLFSATLKQRAPTDLAWRDLWLLSLLTPKAIVGPTCLIPSDAVMTGKARV
jgi:hypothetical protein